MLGPFVLLRPSGHGPVVNIISDLAKGSKRSQGELIPVLKADLGALGIIQVPCLTAIFKKNKNEHKIIAKTNNKRHKNNITAL
jgi:hypothetical protein